MRPRIPQVQEYLAHKKERFIGTLQWEYAQGRMVVLGGVAVSYEPGTPVCSLRIGVS